MAKFLHWTPEFWSEALTSSCSYVQDSLETAISILFLCPVGLKVFMHPCSCLSQRVLLFLLSYPYLWYNFQILKIHCVLVAQAWWLFVILIDCRVQDFSVQRLIQTRMLEWVTIPFCMDHPYPRGATQASHLAGRFYTFWATREARFLYFPYLFKSSWFLTMTGVAIELLSKDGPSKI